MLDLSLLVVGLKKNCHKKLAGLYLSIFQFTYINLRARFPQTLRVLGQNTANYSYYMFKSVNMYVTCVWGYMYMAFCALV